MSVKINCTYVDDYNVDHGGRRYVYRVDGAFSQTGILYFKYSEGDSYVTLETGWLDGSDNFTKTDSFQAYPTSDYRHTTATLDMLNNKIAFDFVPPGPSIDACYVDFDYNEPICSSFNVLGTDADTPIVNTWTSENQALWELLVELDNVIVYSANGTTQTSCTIPVYTLKNATYKFKLRVGNTYLDGTTKWTDYVIREVAITKTIPTITSLEPNNIPQNGDNQILVTFTGSNIDNWSLKVKQNNSIIKTFNGTTITNIVLEPKLLNKGTAQLELTATKNASDVTATKTAEFVVYGKPNPPIINPQDVFNTSLPTFTWTVEQGEQVQYNIVVLDNNGAIHEQKTETSTTNNYTVTNNMSNGLYTVKVRIKNGWDLWSEYGEKTVTIQYTVIPTPTIKGYVDGSNVIVSVIEDTISTFSHNQLYRSVDAKTWTRVANNLEAVDSVTDYTVSKGIKYYYKYRSIGTDGQFADSSVLSFTVDVNNYLLTDMVSKQSLLLNMNPKSNYNRNREVSYNTYAGCSKPTIEIGTTDYTNVSLSMFAEPQTYSSILSMINSNTIVCLRDYMGKQIYGFIVDYKESYEQYIMAYNLTIEIVEINFNTTDMLRSNGTKPVRIVYLDGTYKLDGTIDLRGYVE